MIKTVVIGQGLVATHFVVGLERLKNNEIKDYGIPLRDLVNYKYCDIEVVGSYDVDENKVGKTLYEIATNIFPNEKLPDSLRNIVVNRGVHLGSLDSLPFKARGIEEERGLKQALFELIDEWKSLGVEVVINLITTEYAEAFNDLNKLEEAVRNEELAASQAYAYATALYSKLYRSSAFINCIPTPLANDDAFVKLYENSHAVLFGDDGATGATPLTVDVLEHMRERNRYVMDVAQFNIGGNTDFLSLDIPERNIMKRITKSGVVRDILGYDTPHYIRPTGYLEPLGDKKFVAMIIEYLSFNNYKDEIYIVARINDSPALAGLLVDLVRLGKIAIDRESYGTIYDINAFYMKKPGPRGSRVISKIHAYNLLLEWIGLIKSRK